MATTSSPSHTRKFHFFCHSINMNKNLNTSINTKRFVLSVVNLGCFKLVHDFCFLEWDQWVLSQENFNQFLFLDLPTTWAWLKKWIQNSRKVYSFFSTKTYRLVLQDSQSSWIDDRNPWEGSQVSGLLILTRLLDGFDIRVGCIPWCITWLAVATCWAGESFWFQVALLANTVICIDCWGACLSCLKYNFQSQQ